MYKDLSRKIVFWLTLVVFLYSGYLIIVEPFFNKPSVEINQNLVIPDVSIDKSFFDKIESLKDNEVELSDETEGSSNPFGRF